MSSQHTRDAAALLPWARGDHLCAVDQHLHIDGVDACALVAEYGAPLFVFSSRRLRENAAAILSSFRAVHPNTTVCFASKANANIAVLEELRAAGLAVEINSGGEFHKATIAGFNPADMVFNGVAKLRGELEQVIAAGIKAINVDSLSELARILDVARSLGQQAAVTLRIIPEITGGAAAGWQTGTSKSKFGMTEPEQHEAVALIAANPDFLLMTGVHAHIGTQVNDASAYQREAQFLIDFFRRISALLPYTPAHINLGGGYPKNYSHSTDSWAGTAGHYQQHYCTELDFSALAQTLIRPVSEALGADIEIIVEPGRSMVSDTAVLLSRVEAEKNRLGYPLYYLDAGYSVLFDLYIGWYFHMVNASRADQTELALCRVAGPLCDSSDTYYDVEGEGRLNALLDAEPALENYRQILAQELVRQPGLRELPAATAIGDVLALFDTGAYSLEMMSDYCGRPSAAAVMVDPDQSHRLIRRRAEADDLLRFDVF